MHSGNFFAQTTHSSQLKRLLHSFGSGNVLMMIIHRKRTNVWLEKTATRTVCKRNTPNYTQTPLSVINFQRCYCWICRVWVLERCYATSPFSRPFDCLLSHEGAKNYLMHACNVVCRVRARTAFFYSAILMFDRWSFFSTLFFCSFSFPFDFVQHCIDAANIWASSVFGCLLTQFE